jgi:ribosomal protein S7
LIVLIDYIDWLIILISCRKLSSKKPDEVQTDPLAIFHTAMENAQPVVGVQPIKKAGKTYQV